MLLGAMPSEDGNARYICGCRNSVLLLNFVLLVDIRSSIIKAVFLERPRRDFLVRNCVQLHVSVKKLNSLEIDSFRG